MAIEKSIGMTGVWMECFLFLLYKVVIEISVGMTGVLRRAFLSPPVYTGDRSKRSQDSGFKELVIDESEALCLSSKASTNQITSYFFRYSQ